QRQTETEVDASPGQGVDWRPATGRVLTQTPGVLANLYFRGERIELEGVLRRPPSSVAEGLFDYRSYLARVGIYYQCMINSTNDWAKGNHRGGPDPPLADRFGDWARAALARGRPRQDQPLELLWAMTLG